MKTCGHGALPPFHAAYTFAKSIDNASGAGGGAGISGVVNTGAVNDSGPILGNQNSFVTQRRST